jgi:5-methylcytosine-specific restriction protein A
MPKIAELIHDISRNYLSEKSTYIKATKTVPSWRKIVDVIPVKFVEFLSLPETFKVAGSIGKGNITEIPWVCFFDTEITTSAQTGFYIVLLFKTDMSGFYLSLNQGWTQYQNEYGVKKGKEAIKENAKVAQNALRTISNFNIGSLELGATRPLGKGYELGNIASKYFPLTKPLNEDELF